MKKFLNSDLLLRAAACGFVLTVLLSFTGFAARCGALEENVLRLHVIANSDTEADQAVKLRVRDAVLREVENWYGDAADFDTALAAVCAHLESLETAANRVLAEAEMPYQARAEVCDMYFPTRTYESCKLPAGKYRTLRITLGEAAGQNWWCVVFPSLCIPGASDLDSLPEGAGEVVSQPEKYAVKFKAAELFNALLKFFDE
ncbi:MAG: stage II sporulation protein R [Hominenteromicrobium sp.]